MQTTIPDRQARQGPKQLNLPGWLLVAMILSIGLSPRIRIGQLAGERAIDLRLQDFLLLAGLVALTLSVRGRRLPSLRPVWGQWFVAFTYAAVIVTLLHMLLSYDVSALRRVAYLGRTVESFLLASVVAGLYLAAGSRARRATLRTIHFVILANASWVAYQVATGSARTLLGQDYGAVNYGPQLIGEPSAFGAGAFFVFTVALGVAEYRSRLTSPQWAMTIIAIGAVGAFLSQSRISIGAVGLLALLLIYRTANERRPNAARLGLVIVAGGMLLSGLQGFLGERLTLERIESGFGVRAAEIWPPAVRSILDSPLIGVGPGALGGDDLPWVEAHNIVLRALLDFGIVGAILFFGVFVAIARRGARVSASPSTVPELQTFATTARVFIIAMAAAGLLQDTLTTVTSTHLMMLATGLFAAEYIQALATEDGP